MSMNRKINLVLTGVGGQGVITAANLLGKAAMEAKENVYVSEIHGMAQRGGSVVCNVRMGHVSGPLIPTGQADAILSTEPIESLRYIYYANKKTKVITDINPVIPYTVSIGMDTYPDLREVFEEISKYATLQKIDALRLAKDAGSTVAKNIVLLGALAANDILPFESEILLETILKNFPATYEEINRMAFTGGLKAVMGSE
jgi:indolepyruvate ferredoxin oxidoreductase beta subunit